METEHSNSRPPSFGSVLARRWLIVVATIVVAVAVGLAVSYSQTERYQATSAVLVEPVALIPTANNAKDLDAAEMATQGQVMASLPVAESVIDKLGLSDDPQSLLETVTVQVQGDTRVLRVTADRTSATAAASIADAFSVEYIKYRQSQTTEALDNTVKALRSEAASTRKQLATLDGQIAKANKRQALALGAQRQDLAGQLGQVSAQIENLTQNAGLTQRGGEVLLRSTVPDTPASPRPILDGALAALVGLLLGIGLAYVYEAFNRSRAPARSARTVRSAPRSQPGQTGAQENG